MGDLGRLLMLTGGTLFVLGVLLFLGARIPGFGQMPGDITVQRNNFTLYAPLGTMLIVSVVLTIVLNLIARFWR